MAGFEFWSVSSIAFRWYHRHTELAASGAETTDMWNGSLASLMQRRGIDYNFASATVLLIPVILCLGSFVLISVIPVEMSKHWHVTCCRNSVRCPYLQHVLDIYVCLHISYVVVSNVTNTESRNRKHFTYYGFIITWTTCSHVFVLQHV